MRHKKLIFPGRSGDLPGEMWLPAASPRCLIQLLPDGDGRGQDLRALAGFLTARGAGLAFFSSPCPVRGSFPGRLADAESFGRQIGAYLPGTPLVLWAQGQGARLAPGLLTPSATYCCALLCGASLPGWRQALKDSLHGLKQGGPGWERLFPRRAYLRQLSHIDRSLPLLLTACTGRDDRGDLAGCRRFGRFLGRSAGATELYIFHGLDDLGLEQGPEALWRPLWQWTEAYI